MWISRLKANQEGIIVYDLDEKDFPLEEQANITHANALTTDWNTILPSASCTYIMGNPPFLGHQERNSVQIEDMKSAFSDLEKHGKLDYVCAWYAKAVRYMENTPIKCAFVSTNSITQGESAGILFPYLKNKGVTLSFAYTTFDWESESSSAATVDCVIIGFSFDRPREKHIYYADGTVVNAQNINGYLCNAPDIYIKSRSKNINKNAPKMLKGSEPTFCTKGIENPADLFLTKEEKELFLGTYPELSDCIKRFTGADEYINGIERYVFWFVGVPEERYKNNPYIKELLRKISEQRSNSPTEKVREYWSKYPQLFTQIRQPKKEYLFIPRHSSEDRIYIPMGFLSPDIIVGDAAQMIPDADLFVFGLLTSRMHMAWMRKICGRLESRYRYSPAVYNSFYWPKEEDTDKTAIENCAKEILTIRNQYSSLSLADLYGSDKMPEDLINAHHKLDEEVEKAYKKSFNGDEEKMVSFLFDLYLEHKDE